MNNAIDCKVGIVEGVWSCEDCDCPTCDRYRNESTDGACWCKDAPSACMDCQDDFYWEQEAQFHADIAREQLERAEAEANAKVDAIDALTDALAGIRCRAA